MLYGVRYRLWLQSVVTSPDATPSYYLEHDPAAGVSKIVLDGDELDGPLGLRQITTSETLQGHSAQLSLVVGAIGDNLRQKIQPHDHLRIEFAWDGDWFCAFEGFTTQAVWSRQSTPQGISWRLQISAMGIHKLFNQQWLNWQGLIRFSDDMRVGGAGASLFAKLCAGPMEPTEVLKLFATGAASDLLDVYLAKGPKTGKLGLGILFQLGDGRDWKTFLDLKHSASRQFYYQQQGPLWQIMSALAEPDLHEFFVTYAQDRAGAGAGAAYTEIPTLVFRPRPFPGASGDDADWLALDYMKLGPDAKLPCAIQAMATNDDAQRANSFSLVLGSTSDQSADSAMQKPRLGTWVDFESIKKFGYCCRQISTGLVFEPSFFTEKAPKILERVAYQEAPLPYLWNQTRVYPLFPPAHVGMVVEDSSILEHGAPMTGYLVSVTHAIAITPESIQASTTLGMSRCLDGVSREDYPDAVREFLNLEHVMPAKNEPMERSLEAAKPQGGQSQPKAGQDISRLTASSKAAERGLPNEPDEAARKNLLKMKAETLDPIEQAVGPVRVNSGYRSPAVNRLVGGDSNSLHMQGRAMDITPKNASVTDACNAIKAAGIPVTRCFTEPVGDPNPRWIHIETAGGGLR